MERSIAEDRKESNAEQEEELKDSTSCASHKSRLTASAGREITKKRKTNWFSTLSSRLQTIVSILHGSMAPWLHGSRRVGINRQLVAHGGRVDLAPLAGPTGATPRSARRRRT